MKILPLPNTLYIQTKKVEINGFDTSNYDSAVEYAEVLECGKGAEDIEKGDHIFVKSWGIDIINHESKKYEFVNLETKAVLAIIKND